MVVFLVGGHGFQIVCFEYLVAVQAPDIIDPVAPRQNLGTTVIAGLHKEITPILSMTISLSSPHLPQLRPEDRDAVEPSGVLVLER